MLTLTNVGMASKPASYRILVTNIFGSALRSKAVRPCMEPRDRLGSRRANQVLAGCAASFKSSISTLPLLLTSGSKWRCPADGGKTFSGTTTSSLVLSNVRRERWLLTQWW